MLGEPFDDDLGPPTLLKQLGNVLEAHLARARLESAGIPSFIAGPEAFAGPQGGRSTVGLYVPAHCVETALDLLDHPPELDPASDGDLDATGWLDDPGRPLAFRAFVASIVGWTIVFLTIVGLLIAIPAFAYAIILAIRALRRSTLRDRGLRLQVAASIGLSVLGLAMSALLGVDLLSAR